LIGRLILCFLFSRFFFEKFYAGLRKNRKNIHLKFYIMEISGRITKDAVTAKVSNDREVVNFSIAINDSYRPKGSGELKKIVTYIDCSYWMGSKMAQWLKKGTVVELFGRIGMNVYNNAEGKALGSLTFHTSNIKILVFPKTENTTEVPAVQKKNMDQDTPDDLPF
jgi:single-strand DNA-binding protein